MRRSLPLRLQTTQQLRAYSASGMYVLRARFPLIDRPVSFAPSSHDRTGVCAKEVKFTWHVQVRCLAGSNGSH